MLRRYADPATRIIRSTEVLVVLKKEVQMNQWSATPTLVGVSRPPEGLCCGLHNTNIIKNISVIAERVQTKQEVYSTYIPSFIEMKLGICYKFLFIRAPASEAAVGCNFLIYWK